MSDRPRALFDPTLLRTGMDLRRLGIEPSRTGWHCIRRGIWLPREVWENLSADQRYEAMVFATMLACREPQDIVLAGHSAAVIWGLPTIGPWPSQVRVLQPGGTSGSSRYVLPLKGAPAAPVMQRGVQVTSVPRTVVDLARLGTLETALAAADFALSQGLCTRTELTAEAATVPRGSRGRTTASLVVELADPLSGSPAESLSRLRMFQANIPRPRLQVEYRDESGLIGYVDFDLGVAIGECDGRSKYRVGPAASPSEASEIVWREKKREDRLRRFKPVARWTWQTAYPPGALARHLLSFGVLPQPRSTWIDLGSVRPS